MPYRIRALPILLGALVLVAAIAAAVFLSKTGRESARVAEAQSKVEDLFKLNLDPQVAAQWGRFLRMEGSGYSYPPFMSPGGDYLTAVRRAHFDQGSVTVRIYVPGLSSSISELHPHLQLNSSPVEILVHFNPESPVGAYRGLALLNRSLEKLAKARTVRAELVKALQMHLGPISLEGTCHLAEGNRLRVEAWVSPRTLQASPVLRMVSDGKTFVRASPWEIRSTATPPDLNARYVEEAAKVGFLGPMEFLNDDPG